MKKIKNSKNTLIKKINKLNKEEIKNFNFYFDTIKNDKWWDYAFMLRLWDKKLEQMEINWENSHYVDSKKELKTIKRARKLLKKLIEDRFGDKINDEFYKKHSKILNDITKKFTEEQYYEFGVVLSVSETLKKLAQDEFFELVKLNYEKWWD